MIVRLTQIDGKLPNLALMKIAGIMAQMPLIIKRLIYMMKFTARFAISH